MITICKDNRDKKNKFIRYNKPAIICIIIAIIVPLIILVPTSETDSKGNLDFSTSKYATYGGIIFLSGIVLGAVFSKIAKKYKVSISERMALYAFNTYESISEYKRVSTVKNYKEEAIEALTNLIQEINTRIENLDEKIKWIIPIVTNIKNLSLRLEQNLLPSITSDDQKTVDENKSYLIKLMTYFLCPSESLLEEILSIDIPHVIGGQVISNKKSNIRIQLSRKIWIFATFCGIGVVVYLLALFIGIDKNTAYLSGITLAGFIIGGYIIYLKK